MIERSASVMAPAPSRSKYLISPGDIVRFPRLLVTRAASSRSASLQVPKRVNPQKAPAGSPIRMIPVWLVMLGPPTLKISAGVARDRILFLLKEILKFVFQVKLLFSILTVLIANSTP